MVNRERLVELFKQLVQINAPSRHERDCVDFVKAHLIELGLDVYEDDAAEKVGGNAGNVIATLKGNVEGAPRIFLSAHFDTVEPTAGLSIIEEDGVLRTDETTILGADDKGGMAPAIECIRYFLESGEPHGDVLLLLNVCEENGLLGAGALKIEDLSLDYGFVLDTGPPVGTFINRTATHDSLEVTIYGKPAHSGKDPEKGISAIQVMADAIHHMKLGRIGPETTANFGLVSGGTGVNVVCPWVKLSGEARSTSVVDLDEQTGHMKQVLIETAEKWGARVELHHERHYQAYILDEGSEVIRIAQAAAKQLGLSGELRTTLGGSDANQFNAKGVLTTVVATGMDKIHTHQEFIRIEDLVKTTELAIEIVRQAAASRKLS